MTAYEELASLVNEAAEKNIALDEINAQLQAANAQVTSAQEVVVQKQTLADAKTQAALEQRTVLQEAIAAIVQRCNDILAELG